MMAGVGDSEIGGHTQSTLLYKVVPELSFNLKVENLRSSATIGNKRLAGFLDNLKLGNESRVEFIKLLSEASPNMLQILNNSERRKFKHTGNLSSDSHWSYRACAQVSY